MPFENDFLGGFMFNIFPIIFCLVFLVVISTFVFAAIKGIRTWNSNNKQPILTVPTKIVAKRTSVRTWNNNTNGHMHHNSSTSYFATFQVESGDRMEFPINADEYGMLAEGDFGKLTFQGTRYLGFTRIKP
jgi:hypothetical protein